MAFLIMPSKFLTLPSIRTIPIVSSPRYSAIRMMPILSAAFFARSMAAKLGTVFFTRTKIPAALTSRSTHRAPNVVYATLWQARQGPWEDRNAYGAPVGGIFKSSDGGTTWQQLNKGLPAQIVQAYVAISPSEPSRLYATVATPRETGGYASGAGLGIYRSDDAGENWYQVTTDPRPAERIGGGDLPVPKVDPKNPDVLYSASIVTWRSADGGKTWTGFRGAPGGDDYQNIWINPNNPDIILLVGDQGALVTVNRGATWSSWYNQPTAQLYHAIADNQFPYRVYGGQQESGSVGISSRGNDGEITFRDWHPVGVD